MRELSPTITIAASGRREAVRAATLPQARLTHDVVAEAGDGARDLVEDRPPPVGDQDPEALGACLTCVLDALAQPI